jgi:hypothetical protein
VSACANTLLAFLPHLGQTLRPVSGDALLGLGRGTTMDMGTGDRRQPDRRAAGTHLALLAVPAALGLLLPSCASDLDLFSTRDRSCTSSSHFEALVTHRGVERIDLLLAIDNSRSMADKQAILAQAVPDMVDALVNPRCIHPDGSPAASQPAGPLDPCPQQDTWREVPPVLDIHVGVVSSSLGGHGGDVCPDDEVNATNDDMGRLITRQLGGGTVPTYLGLGFLAWDPAQTLSPPGMADATALSAAAGTLVAGAGEVGCGLEAQLESWYRFLIDPNPYQSIEQVSGLAVLSGTDDNLLAERRAFLRSDSLVAIVMLSDENDCSIRDGGQYFFAAQVQHGGSDYHLPRAQSACATNPNDPCCLSCGQAAGAGCPPWGAACASHYDALEDPIALRCFDQKRRFGIDFLYPIDRYVAGLSSALVADRDGTLVPNPLFSDLDPHDDIDTVRDPSLVYLAGIVGVPWQDVARKDGGGNPDLLAGLDADGKTVGGLQSSRELTDIGTWDLILGDPSSYVPASDAHMVESIDPRPGLVPPSASYLADPVNGHEHTPDPSLRDDLQYACIFALPEPRDCLHTSGSCDCTSAPADNPLCQSPEGAYGTTQVAAKAYPGLRHLQLLKAMGSQGIVAPICPAQIDDAARSDFGFRPAIGAVLERIRSRLAAQCLPTALTPVGPGRVECTMLEAGRVDGRCTCSGAGRAIPDEALDCTIEHLLAEHAADGWNCVCELTQLSGAEIAACQNDASTDAPTVDGQPVDGWCYLDSTAVPELGNPELTGRCPGNARRLFRFVGRGRPSAGATTLVSCQDD